MEVVVDLHEFGAPVLLEDDKSFQSNVDLLGTFDTVDTELLLLFHHKKNVKHFDL